MSECFIPFHMTSLVFEEAISLLKACLTFYHGERFAIIIVSVEFPNA